MPRPLHLIGQRGALKTIILGLSAACCLAFNSAAEQITLRSVSDGYQVTGDLRSFDGAFYIIQTETGPVTVSADRVTCEGSDCPATLETTGFSVTAAPSLATVALPGLIEAFAFDNGLPLTRETLPDGVILYRIGVSPTDRRFAIAVRSAISAEAFADLATEVADVILTDRLATPAEVTFLQDAGMGDLTAPAQERLLALDALVPVTSPQRPILEVAPDSLAALFVAEMPDWSMLGAEAGQLRLHLPAEGVETGRFIAVEGSVAASITYHATAADVAAVVRDQRSGLGLLPLSEVAATRVMPLATGCGISHPATPDTLATGQYPWLLPVMLYQTTARPNADLERFLAFLRSDIAQRVLARAGFVTAQAGVTDMEREVGFQRALAAADDGTLPALRKAAQTMIGAQHIRLSFPKAREDRLSPMIYGASVTALADAIADGQYDGAQLLMIGHAGAGGSEAQSLADANQLLADVHSIVPPEDMPDVAVETLGFGQILPIGCADDDWSGALNPRVEVWLRTEPAPDTPPREN